MKFSHLLFLLVCLALGSSVADAQQSCDSWLGCDAACDSIESMSAGCDAIGSECQCDRCQLEKLLLGCAEQGVIFSGDLVQNYQGVVDGGLQQQDRFGGLATYGALFDFGKLGLTEGTILKVQGQSQFGQFANADTGALLYATNTNGILPTSAGQETALTDFLLTQFLSERFAIFAGRFNTFDGTLNAFAHGRGKTQFMNVGLVTNPIAFRTVPYVTYGVGLTVIGDEGTPTFTFSVIDPNDYATRTDLDELYKDGVTISTEVRLPTRWQNRPGHVLLGGTWSNREVVDLNEIPRLPTETPVALPRTSDSWSIYGNFDHYITTYDCAGTRGWGVFGRWGIADDDSNPVEYFLSAGIGGNSPLRCRENDTFGLGWYYGGTTDQIPGLIFNQDSQGFEAFYGIALTDKVFLSPDVQWLQPARGNIDNAWLVGMRLFVTM